MHERMQRIMVNKQETVSFHTKLMLMKQKHYIKCKQRVLMC